MQFRRLVPLYLFVFVDLLGYSLFLPLLPFYAQTFNASATLVGLMLAVNALAQLIATPVIGRFSDRFGRRPLLIFSLVGTIAGFLVLALAEPLGRALVGLLPASIVGADPLQATNNAILGVLFISRIVDGLAGGNIALARAYITDVTDEKNRARGLGMIGAVFGLGFIIGPVFGGTLSNWGWAASLVAPLGLSRFAVPALFAVLLSIVNLVGLILLLPESLTPEIRARMTRTARRTLHPGDLWDALQRPRFGSLVMIRFVYGLAFTLFTANFALYAQYQLSLTDQSTSYILAYVGILVVLVQGMAIGRLTDRFQEKQLVFAAIALLAAALLAWAFVPNVALLLVVLAPLALAGGTLNTVSNSMISKAIYPEEVGGAMGLNAGLESLTRVIAPLLGGLWIGSLGAWSLGVFGAAMAAALTYYAWRRLLLLPDLPLPPRSERAGPPESAQIPS